MISMSSARPRMRFMRTVVLPHEQVSGFRLVMSPVRYRMSGMASRTCW